MPQDDELLARFRIPDPGGLVSRGRSDLASVLGHRHIRYRIRVASQRQTLLSCRHIPIACSLVVGCRNNQRSVRREYSSFHNVAVTAEYLELLTCCGVPYPRGFIVRGSD